MAHPLRALVALVEDLGSFLIPYHSWSQLPVAPAPGHVTPSSGVHGHRHTYRKHTHTWNIFFKSIRIQRLSFRTFVVFHFVFWSMIQLWRVQTPWGIYEKFCFLFFPLFSNSENQNDSIRALYASQPLKEHKHWSVGWHWALQWYPCHWWSEYLPLAERLA